ncbi:MAG: response regulator transcription factor [Treponema sp.]|jgi:DNA-binding response OmpR family regulator|nr:response regulator transcription factor [Treponema sp.]
MKRILIVEDDADIAAIQTDFLHIAGFDVEVVLNGKTGLERALSKEFDLILLDLMLPGISGIEICKKIRDEINIPIIMVTAKAADSDKIRGLGIGADDYIAKPFSPPELVARVKANLAQHERLTTDHSQRIKKIRTGNITIDTATQRVYVNEQEIELKNKEYELLQFMAQNPDIVFDRETLYERVWGMDSAGDTATVSVHINRLREKIEANPAKPRYIQTVWGAGYRFRA